MKSMMKNLFNTNADNMQALGENLILTLIVIIATYFIANIIIGFIKRSLNKVEQFDKTALPLIATTLKVFIYLISLIIILDIYGVNTSSILAVLGTAGLAIGLALKDTLSNVAAGFVLIILRPFKVGHFIEFGSTSGTVKEINLLTTILETGDSLYISCPNSCLWGVPLKNYTKNGKRRLDLVVGISYNDSIDKAFEVFKNIINEEERFLKDPAPQMMVLSMGDSCVNVQLRAWLSVSDFWPVQWKLNKELKEKIEEAGLSIPFPQREINIISEKSLKA